MERENGSACSLRFLRVIMAGTASVILTVEEQRAKRSIALSLCLHGWIRPASSLQGWAAPQLVNSRQGGEGASLQERRHC